MWKNFVIQTPWKLSGIYNMVYSLVLANKIDSPRQYFRVYDLQSGVPKWYIVVEYIVSLPKLRYPMYNRVFLHGT